MAYKFTNPAKYTYQDGALFLGKSGGQTVGVETEVHAITIGGSGSGKGAGLLVQNARRWPQSLVLIDPKGENAALSYQHRIRLHGADSVCVLDPFKVAPVPESVRGTINPLAAIKADDPRARSKINALANGMIVVHDTNHMEWVEGARALLAGGIAYVAADCPPEMRSLPQVRNWLMQPDDVLFDDAEKMANDMRMSGLIRAAGVTLLTAFQSSKSIERDFLNKARQNTKWLDDEAIAACLSSSSFDLDRLTTGKASLFLVLPPDDIAENAAFLRLFVKAALSVMGTQSPLHDEKKAECLFLLDEFYSLGKLDELIESSGRMRSYGVHLWPFMQSLSQFESLYGKNGVQTFLTNAGAVVFLGNDQDDMALRYISERIGKLTAAEVAEPFEPSDPFGAKKKLQELNPLPPESEWVSSEQAGYGVANGDFYIKGYKYHQKKVFGFTKTETVPVYESVNFHNVMLKHALPDMEKSQAHADALRKAQYEHAMRSVGQPRLTPDEIAKLVGKGQGDKLARSMIVFLNGGDKLNIQVAPFFDDPHWYSLDYEEERKARIEEHNRKAFLDLFHRKYAEGLRSLDEMPQVLIKHYKTNYPELIEWCEAQLQRTAPQSSLQELITSRTELRTIIAQANASLEKANAMKKKYGLR